MHNCAGGCQETSIRLLKEAARTDNAVNIFPLKLLNAATKLVDWAVASSTFMQKTYEQWFLNRETELLYKDHEKCVYFILQQFSSDQLKGT